MRATRRDAAILVLFAVFSLELLGLEWLARRDRALRPAGVEDSPARAAAGLANAAPSRVPAPPESPDPDEGEIPGRVPIERVPLPRAEESEPNASVVEVVRAEGGPCAWCPVVAVHGDAVVAASATNENGAAELPVTAGPVDLLVDACGALHREAAVTLALGHQRIVLPPELAIAGKVVFDDGRMFPGAEMFLDVLRDDPPPRARGLPEPLRRALSRDFGIDRKGRIEPDGTFRLTGFEPGWTGRVALRPIERVELIDPATRDAVITIPIRAPAEGLVLHAHRHPVIRGRIVADAGMQLPRARFRVELTAFRDDAPELTRWVGCDLRATFELPIDFRPPRSAGLRVSSIAEERVGCVVPIAGPFDRDVELGDLTLGELPELPRTDDPVPPPASGGDWWTFSMPADPPGEGEEALRARVVDENGKPVSEAAIQVRGRLNAFARTGDDGAFALNRRLAGPVDLTITAPRLVPFTEARTDAQAIDGRTFVMRRGRSVRLVVVDELGAPFVRPHHLDRCDHEWEVWATAAGFDLKFWPEMFPCDAIGGHPESPAGPGIYDFAGLPDDAVTFHVEDVDRVYTLAGPPGANELRLVVPAHGRVRILLGFKLDDRIVRVRLEPVASSGTKIAFADGFGLHYHGGVLLEALLPGDYVLHLEHRAGPRSAEQVAIIPPVTFAVRAGETTVVTLNRAR